MAKALFFLIAEGGNIDTLQTTLMARLKEQFTDQPHATVQLMRQPETDFFYNPESPHPCPNLVLEVITAPGKPMATLQNRLKQVLEGASLDSASMVLLMQARTYIPGPPQPFYYYYLMNKRADFTTADYNDYYSKYHCRMAFNTPEVGAYWQNYIDQAGSEALAQSLGLGCREVTSISELALADVTKFVSAPELMDVVEPAAADEERFVDRADSVAFTSEVVLRIGDFERIGEAIYEQYFPE